MTQFERFSIALAIALYTTNVYAIPTSLPDLYATVNGDFAVNIRPGTGLVTTNGAVTNVSRMTVNESGNSWSAFGVTTNSKGEYWTSSGDRLIQFHPKTGSVLQSLERVDQPFLHLVFEPDGSLLGWSNSNGYLYDIELIGSTYTERQRSFVGLNAGGLTEMAFSPDGILFGINNRDKRLITIDPDSGLTTTIWEFGVGSYIGLAFTTDGSLFTTDSLTRSIIQLDKTGNELWRGLYDSDTPIMGLEFGLAFISEPFNLTLIGLGLASTGYYRRRRSKIAA